MHNLLPFLVVLLFNNTVSGQVNPWSEIDESLIAAEPGTRDIVPDFYRTLHLNLPLLKSTLATAPEEYEFVAGEAGTTIDFPLPYGGYSTFEIWEAPVMHPDLTAKFPDIRSYAGRNRDGDMIRFAVSPLGLQALVLTVERSNTYSLTLYARGTVEDYICFARKDCPIPADQQIQCMVSDTPSEAEEQAVVSDRAGSCGNLRTYRLALACTGEYANFYGATGTNKAPVIAVMNATMTEVNAIFEIDAGIRMIMVANNDDLVYTDPSSDPYTDDDLELIVAQNVTNCNNVIGSANYDIGHVFKTNNLSMGTLGSVCGTNKARAASGGVDLSWRILLVTHEMGHQFSARHTMYCTNGSGVEPGSGTTVMSYAGSSACQPKVMETPEPYFHASSIAEIVNFASGTTCVTLVPNGNSAPVCGAIVNKTIPKSTPFVLTATEASDPDGDILSFCWEQMDLKVTPIQPMPPLSTNKNGPVFRSQLPGSSPSRYFPKFEDVLNNTNDTWEVVPSIARKLNFRVTIRDNHANGGCTTEKNVVLTVKATAGPFVVTQPNTAVTWPGGSSQPITWNVAGTSANGVNCNTVAILLSTDGGATFTTLLANTPNDGSQAVTIPNTATSQARIMVQAVGNVFYDVSNVNFTITNTQPPQLIGQNNPSQETLLAFPNPSAGFIQVHTPSAWNDQPLLLRIWDMEGRIVLEETSFISGSTVDLALLVKGVYQLEVIRNDERLQQGFVRL